MRAARLFCLVGIACVIVVAVAVAQDRKWNPERVLSDYLKEHYPWAEVGIENLTFTAPVPNEPPVRVTVDKGPPGRTVFSLEFAEGRKIGATADVKALDQIVMTARAFRKGYRVQAGDVYTKLTDAARIPSGAVRNPDDVIDKMLTRSVTANTPLLSGMVTDMPLVKRGQRVTLVIDAPTFRMTAPGETREGSYVGSDVKAVNTASRKTVTGQLVDENTVMVDF